MNREQAETLLSALVADELDEPYRGELLAYLKTDPALAERLGDMRLAARLLREGLEHASAEAPVALDEGQRAELLALAERDPISEAPPSVSPKPRMGALFSIRIVGAAAACVALFVGLLGMMLPELGEARRSARRMQNSPADADQYWYDSDVRIAEPSVVVPQLESRQDVRGTLRTDGLEMLVDRSESGLVIIDGHADNLLNQTAGTLGLASDYDRSTREYFSLSPDKDGEASYGPVVSQPPQRQAIAEALVIDPLTPSAGEVSRLDQNRRGEYSGGTGLASMIGGRLPQSHDNGSDRAGVVVGGALVDTDKQRERLERWAYEKPSLQPSRPVADPEPAPEPEPVDRFIFRGIDGDLHEAESAERRRRADHTGDGIALAKPVAPGSAAQSVNPSGGSRAEDWSGSVVWNDNHIGYEAETPFETRYANGWLDTAGYLDFSQGLGTHSGDWRRLNDLTGLYLGGGQGQQGQQGANLSGLIAGDSARYDSALVDNTKLGDVNRYGVQLDPRDIWKESPPDESVVLGPGVPAESTEGVFSFSLELPLDLPATQPPDSTLGYVDDLIPDSPSFDRNAEVDRGKNRGRESVGESGSGLMAQARANTAAEKAEQAGKAMREGRLNTAVQNYEDAALLDPGNADYQAQLAEAKAKLNEKMRPLGVLDKTTVDRAVDHRSAVVAYEKAMAEAASSLEKQDFLAASNAVIEARTILSRERQTFDSTDYIALVDRANQLQSLAQTTQARVEAGQLTKIERERSQVESRVAQESERRKAEEIQGYLRKARALQLEKKYDQALAELDSALFLEPDNPVIKGLRDMIQDTAVAVDSFELKRARDLGIAGQTLQNLEASTPYNDILTYPGDWPELTAERLAGLEGVSDASEEADKAAKQALGRVVTLGVENARLGSIIDYVRDTTGANVAVNWPALELAGVTRDTPITIRAEDVSTGRLLKDALDQAAGRQGQGEKLGFAISEGVVKVTTLRDLQDEADTRVYDIRALLNRSSGQGRERQVAQIIATLKSSGGQPDRWEDEDYTIHELNGHLIVRTTAGVHRGMADMLEQLKAEGGDAAEADPALAPPVNPWVLTEHDAQSTFALDTDTASYDLARRTIREQAQLPPIASVRMEEFVNRFDYQYPAGRDAHDTFTVHAEAGPAPFADPGSGGVVLLKVGVRGRVVARDQMKPAHYVFVIDASGSMAREDRLPLVQQSLAMLLGQLGEADTVSLVSYETRPYLLLEHAPASDPGRIIEAASTIQTGGSTNLADGLKLGYQVAAKHFVSGSVNRVILCSDGVANVGNDDAKQMLDAVREYRRHGVTLMTVGVGADGQAGAQAASGAERFNDGLMEQLANRGDGRYLYIGSAEDARRQFVEDLAATRPTIAYDAKIQVHFDQARVRRYRLIGYENREIADRDFRNDAVDAGEVGSGQSATALYELELWPTPVNRAAGRLAADRGRLGTVYVRYRDARSGAVEETSTALLPSVITERAVADHPRFYLAACAAEFAELLRESEHAKGGTYARLHRVAQEVAAALPLDKDAAELAELIGRADGLPRAGQ